MSNPHLAVQFVSEHHVRWAPTLLNGDNWAAAHHLQVKHDMPDHMMDIQRALSA
jgi:hypothetical protein